MSQLKSKLLYSDKSVDVTYTDTNMDTVINIHVTSKVDKFNVTVYTHWLNVWAMITKILAAEGYTAVLALPTSDPVANMAKGFGFTEDEGAGYFYYILTGE